MRIAVLGTGNVGTTLAAGFARHGHDVVLGTRDPAARVAAAWVKEHSGAAATFPDAAGRGEVVFLALKGEAVLDVVQQLGSAADGKVVVDVTNPLDFSHGFPPRLFTPPGTSLGEQVQQVLPQARVVKALNTVNCEVMVNPRRLTEPTSLFLAGDDGEAKRHVRRLLEEFGWHEDDVVDLGGIAGARAAEAYMLTWVALFQSLGTADVNVRVIGPAQP